MSPKLTRTSTGRFLVAAAAISCVALIVAGTVIARAAELGPLEPAAIGAASDSTRCNGLTLTQTYLWRTSTTYEVETLKVSNVPPHCQGLKYALVFTQGNAAGTVAATRRNGTLDNDSETVIAMTTGQRPKLADVNNTTSTLKANLLIGEN